MSKIVKAKLTEGVAAAILLGSEDIAGFTVLDQSNAKESKKNGQRYQSWTILPTGSKTKKVLIVNRDQVDFLHNDSAGQKVLLNDEGKRAELGQDCYVNPKQTFRVAGGRLELV